MCHCDRLFGAISKRSGNMSVHHDDMVQIYPIQEYCQLGQYFENNSTNHVLLGWLRAVYSDERVPMNQLLLEECYKQIG